LYDRGLNSSFNSLMDLHENLITNNKSSGEKRDKSSAMYYNYKLEKWS